MRQLVGIPVPQILHPAPHPVLVEMLPSLLVERVDHLVRFERALRLDEREYSPVRSALP
jgi:hypothetical protein